MSFIFIFSDVCLQKNAGPFVAPSLPHRCLAFARWPYGLRTWWVGELEFLTAILHRGLRNDFFCCCSHTFFCHILSGIFFVPLIPSSIISLSLFWLFNLCSISVQSRFNFGTILVQFQFNFGSILVQFQFLFFSSLSMYIPIYLIAVCFWISPKVLS